MKQNVSSLLAEKQAKAKQLQQINASVDFLKMKMARGEEQVHFFGSLTFCFAHLLLTTISLSNLYPFR